MDLEYLNKLSPAVRAFVEEVEQASGLAIEVMPSAQMNEGGPDGHGKLSIDIEAESVQLNVPTNGYLPNGAVRHEVLHVRRLLVDGVPRLAVADEADGILVPQSSLTHVDNALEHLLIVPEELHHHPERREHWDSVMRRAWLVKVPQAPDELNRRIDACLHWAFLRHVLPTSTVLEVAAGVLQTYGLRDDADSFADALCARLGDKVEVVKFFFDQFAQLQRAEVALEYLNRATGRTQHALPG